MNQKYEELSEKAKKKYQQQIAEYRSSGAAASFAPRTSKSPMK